jgi:ribosomal protein S18 acetylase RimI-like enzyme
MRIAEVHSTADIAVAGELFREYQAELSIDLCFQGFAEELASLPGVYARPMGRLLLALDGGDTFGCVGLKAFRGEVGEMKRLYVRSAYRGKGVGYSLVREVIAQAKSIGYKSMVLDTLPSMVSAMSLYEAFGFKRRESYYETPIIGTVFMELGL